MTKFKPGDRIVVPWSPGTVAGTVVSLFPGEEYARLVLEFPSDDDRPRLQHLTLPVDLLERAPRGPSAPSGRRVALLPRLGA